MIKKFWDWLNNCYWWLRVNRTRYIRPGLPLDIAKDGYDNKVALDGIVDNLRIMMVINNDRTKTTNKIS